VVKYSKENNIGCFAQKAYEQSLTPFLRVTAYVPEKVSHAIVYTLAFALVFIQYYKGSVFTHTLSIGVAEWMMIGSLLLSLMTIFCAELPLTRLKVNRMFTAVYCASAVLILLPAFFHPVGDGYRPFAVIMLILFPCVFFAWRNGDTFSRIVGVIAHAIMISGIPFVLISLVAANPFSAEYAASTAQYRYVGLSAHPNILGMLMAESVICGIYLIYTGHGKRSRAISAVSIVVCMPMLVISGSRTSIMAVVITVFLIALLWFRKKKARGRSVRLRHLAIIVIVILVAIVVAMTIIMSSSRGISLGGQGLGASGIIDRMLSGRVGVWKASLEMVTPLGIDIGKHPVTIGDMMFYGAHNVPLDFAIRCGVFEGVAYLALEVIALIYAVRRVFAKSEISKTDVFVCISIVVYVVYSMFELDRLMFFSPWTFCFFVSFAPLMFSRKGKENREQNQKN